MPEGPIRRHVVTDVSVVGGSSFRDMRVERGNSNVFANAGPNSLTLCRNACTRLRLGSGGGSGHGLGVSRLGTRSLVGRSGGRMQALGAAPSD